MGLQGNRQVFVATSTCGMFVSRAIARLSKSRGSPEAELVGDCYRSPNVAEITIHETTDGAGSLVRTCLRHDDGVTALRVNGELLPLPDGALDAVMKRYGKPLDARAAERDMRVDERLELGGGCSLVRFRFLRRYDVIARDYLALYRPDEEPLCEMATSIAAALDHLARRLAAAQDR